MNYGRLDFASRSCEAYQNQLDRKSQARAAPGSQALHSTLEQNPHRAGRRVRRAMPNLQLVQCRKSCVCSCSNASTYATRCPRRSRASAVASPCCRAECVLFRSCACRPPDKATSGVRVAPAAPREGQQHRSQYHRVFSLLPRQVRDQALEWTARWLFDRCWLAECRSSRQSIPQCWPSRFPLARLGEPAISEGSSALFSRFCNNLVCDFVEIVFELVNVVELFVFTTIECAKAETSRLPQCL